MALKLGASDGAPYEGAMRANSAPYGAPYESYRALISGGSCIRLCSAVGAKAREGISEEPIPNL